ncbi:aminopeptidase [Acidipila sp. EB88]|uniref:aminopeptidase n=1 Tax=Acidipila sp. EB88 TaxID=2305226 RepID=UPI000F5F6C7A|nr:aminopeptidase [Acidipila sp. EB88]RRA48965.1 aminopeptidase [Acidipila sp. EB88]
MASVIAASPTASSTLADRIDLLAQVTVHSGLGLRAGQELLITAPIDALPLVRRVTEHAYKAGASLVTTMYVDDEATLARYRFAEDASFDHAATWLHDGIATAYRSGAARLGITGADPSLLGQQDPVKVSRANVAASKASRPALELITRHEINWCIVASATPAWARVVFPGEPEEIAVQKLWDAILASSRLDNPDPVAAWKQHSANLQQRAALLNEKRYAALRYTGPGTDLEIGLADGHLWMGGGTVALNGIPCLPNIPTEEVFTTPHRERASGTVRSTKPLSYQGTLIEEITVRFEGGRIVEARARTGQEVLERMLATDEGAGRLGEVALVPHSSPISASGLLFSNTLFDENAACHIAMGQAYSTCVQDGDTLSPEELAARGANESLIHVDWMIGSGTLDIDGVTASGEREPVMRAGEWA